jgi:iron complex outermembrane receptor protein
MPDGYISQALPWGNAASGNSYGFEIAAELQLRDWWHLPVAYSYVDLDLEADPGSRDISNRWLTRSDSRQSLSLRSLMTPREDLDLDLWLRFVDQGYPDVDLGPYGGIRIPAYWDLDLRVAWRPKPGVELAVVGQNLLHDAHLEGYQPTFGGLPVEVERGIYGSVRIDF